jgi:flagellar motor switch protein FliN/FliY
MYDKTSESEKQMTGDGAAKGVPPMAEDLKKAGALQELSADAGPTESADAQSPDRRSNPQPGVTMAEAMAVEAMPGANQAFAAADLTSAQRPVPPADVEALSPAEKAHRKTANIDLLMDVNLPVSIELGRTRMTISDILELGCGSIVELDKLAGEPVDILVNNKMLAKGEVVVLDENFGVRITSLVSPRERLERLKS